MSDQTSLSGEEISALMSGSREAPAAAAGPSGPARSFAFGSAAGRPMAALPAVDRINERMVRRLRDAIEPFARAKPRVTADPTVVRTFTDWQAEQAEFTSLSIYAAKPMKGAILVRIDPEFISRLVDARYGGSGTFTPRRMREFTATEENLLERLSETIAGALAHAWAESVPVKPQLRSRETNVAFAGIAKADEAVAVVQFAIQPWTDAPATIEIVYPLASLRSVEEALAARSSEEAGARSAEWRARLGAAVGEVRIDARTVLARPELSLSELMQLRVGDVIPVSLPAHVPLLVAGRKIATGTVGEHDGRAALKIDKMEQRRFVS